MKFKNLKIATTLTPHKDTFNVLFVINIRKDLTHKAILTNFHASSLYDWHCSSLGLYILKPCVKNLVQLDHYSLLLVLVKTSELLDVNYYFYVYVLIILHIKYFYR